MSYFNQMVAPLAGRIAERNHHRNRARRCRTESRPRYHVRAMWWRRKYDAFISYSHKDAGVVKPLVELLSLNQRRVFWDRQLAPGDRWDEVLQSSVKDASVFVLFWCCDTRGADYISKEIALALRLKKKIVPVKLCDAAMPAPLGEWQWIDLQQRVSHQCVPLDHEMPEPPAAPAPVPVTLPAPHSQMPSAPRLPDGVPPPSRLHAGPFLRPLLVAFGIVLLVVGIGVQLPRSARPPAPVTRGSSTTGTAEAPAAVERDSQQGPVVQRPKLPSPPGPPRVEIHPHTLPWWYRNRIALTAASFFVAAVALFAWLISAARKRTAQTLDLTRTYLERLGES